jgi:thiamine-phosphate pyrophosphorylase
MPLEAVARFPVMCLTQDGLEIGHVEQARRLCAAGARWIQLRMKGAAPDHWRATAAEVVTICHAHAAVCIVNDSVEVTLAAGADGVHLGREDLDWSSARTRLGPDLIIGGTVNDAPAADRAREAHCLDYVGVGPLRFTATKLKLAPVLGLAGIRDVLGRLGDLPAWVIGGVEAADLPSVRAVGAAGVAVSSALFRGGRLEDNFGAFVEAAQAAGPLASTESASAFSA